MPAPEMEMPEIPEAVQRFAPKPPAAHAAHAANNDSLMEEIQVAVRALARLQPPPKITPLQEIASYIAVLGYDDMMALAAAMVPPEGQHLTDHAMAAALSKWAKANRPEPLKYEERE